MLSSGRNLTVDSLGLVGSQKGIDGNRGLTSLMKKRNTIWKSW